MPKFPIRVPRIPTIEPRPQADPRWLNMRTGGISRMPRGLAKDRVIIRDPQEELYGPELPYDLAYARDEGRMYDYDQLWAKERARQAYNRKLYEDAIRQRKEELWRDYYQNNEVAMDAISPRQMKRLDSEFDNRARWQVRGIEDPEDPYGWSEMDEAEFREYYKDAPWRMW